MLGKKRTIKVGYSIGLISSNRLHKSAEQKTVFRLLYFTNRKQMILCSAFCLQIIAYFEVERDILNILLILFLLF